MFMASTASCFSILTMNDSYASCAYVSVATGTGTEKTSSLDFNCPPQWSMRPFICSLLLSIRKLESYDSPFCCVGCKRTRRTRSEAYRSRGMGEGGQNCQNGSFRTLEHRVDAPCP